MFERIFIFTLLVFVLTGCQSAFAQQNSRNLEESGNERELDNSLYRPYQQEIDRLQQLVDNETNEAQKEIWEANLREAKHVATLVWSPTQTAEELATGEAHQELERIERAKYTPRPTETRLPSGIYSKVEIMDPVGFVHTSAYRDVDDGKNILIKAGVSTRRSGIERMGKGTLYIVQKNGNGEFEERFLYTEEQTGALHILGHDGDRLQLESQNIYDLSTQVFEFDLVNMELIGQVQPQIQEVVAYPVPETESENPYPAPLSVNTTKGSSESNFVYPALLVGVSALACLLFATILRKGQQKKS